MCLIVLSYQPTADFPLVVAANRDEFYARPSAPLSWWQDEPTILAGRDLKEGGTWMGVTIQGSFAAVTNFRTAEDINFLPSSTKQLSRGFLVHDFLQSGDPLEFSKYLVANAARYKGFNLFFGNINHLYYFSNHSQKGVEELTPGVYGLSNHLLNTPWYKVTQAKKMFQQTDPSDSEAVFSLLKNDTPAPDDQVQQTGFPFVMEKMLSSIFIKAPGYGTRVSSHLCLSKNEIRFAERTYSPT